MNNKSQWPSVITLLAFSTLTQADDRGFGTHNHYETQKPALFASVSGSNQSRRLHNDGTVTLRRLPVFDPRQRELQWQRTGATEGRRTGSRDQGSQGQSKCRQRLLSGRRIDTESLASDTTETGVDPESSEPTPDGQATHTLTYHWRQYAGTSLCSKVPFQLLVLPSDINPELIVEEAQLGEHGCFCAAISPTVAEGQAELYFNAGEGQLDAHLSTLETNGQSVPLDQLEPLCVEVLIQGHGLELSAALVEGFEDMPQQPLIRLDASRLKVRQYGSGQSRQRDPGKNYHDQTTQSSSSGRSSQSVTPPPHAQGTTGANNGDDDDRDPDQRDFPDQDNLDRTDTALELLVASLVRLLQTTEPKILDTLADDLEHHLAVQGVYGNDIPTLNVRLHHAIDQLGLIMMEWREVLAYLQAHLDRVEGFVRALGGRNRAILRAAINRLSEPEAVVTTRARKVSRSKSTFKHRSISLPDLLAVNMQPEQPNSTLTSILYPLLCQTLPQRSRWRQDTSIQRVLECLGKVFEELPAEWRFSSWQRLMQALGLPEALDFSHYRIGLAQRIHQFMDSRRGSRQRLARALAETLPAGTVNNMILDLASSQGEREGGQPLTEQEVICPVSEADEAGLEDLLKKLRATISDEELLRKLLGFLQLEHCPLDETNLNTVFCRQLGTPFGSEHWQQALLQLYDSRAPTRLSEFVLALNGTNRACLAWGLSTLNHVSGRLSEVMRAQAALGETGVERPANPAPTRNDLYKSIPRIKPEEGIPGKRMLPDDKSVSGDGEAVSISPVAVSWDEESVYVPMMPVINAVTADKGRDSATGQ